MAKATQAGGAYEVAGKLVNSEGVPVKTERDHEQEARERAEAQDRLEQDAIMREKAQKFDELMKSKSVISSEEAARAAEDAARTSTTTDDTPKIVKDAADATTAAERKQGKPTK